MNKAIKNFWKERYNKSYTRVKLFNVQDKVQWESAFDGIKIGLVIGFGLQENELDLHGDNGKQIIQVIELLNNEPLTGKIHSINVLNLTKI